MTNIMAKFMWLVARVDSRQYRQNSTELQPERFWVGVEVPLEKEYIFNAEEILKAQLGSGNVDVPTPIYTAKALQFCLDNLGEYLRDPEPDDFKQENPDAEDWGNTSESPKEEIDWSDSETDKAASGALTDDWGKEADNDVKEIWNENEEKWDE